MALVEHAPAKVNLTLVVTGRRADGYHTLDSLVVFADVADRLTLAPGAPLSLEVAGPEAAGCGPVEDNLVLAAARAFDAAMPGAVTGAFHLDKMLPAAAGLGGGSSDAAAALRLLARANGMAPSDPRLRVIAARIGADVTVCLDPRPQRMRGIGHDVSAVEGVPALHAVLVNPRVPSGTRAVFGALGLETGTSTGRMGPDWAEIGSAEALFDAVRTAGNDLEAAAVAASPKLLEVRAAMSEAVPGISKVSRGISKPSNPIFVMSGSGSTWVALWGSAAESARFAREMAALRPGWWVSVVILGHSSAVSRPSSSRRRSGTVDGPQ